MAGGERDRDISFDPEPDDIQDQLGDEIRIRDGKVIVFPDNLSPKVPLGPVKTEVREIDQGILDSLNSQGYLDDQLHEHITKSKRESPPESD